jgi:hypothetical protein
MMVEVTAYFGFIASGSSDNGRTRTITTPISPTSVQQILDLQEAGATEEDLHPLVVEPSPSRISLSGALAPMVCVRIFTHVQAVDFLF